MKKTALLFITITLLTSSTFIANAQVKTDIEKANKKGKAVFLIVTNGKEDIEHAKKLALESKKQVLKSEVFTLNRSDKINAELVKKYGVAGTPTPLILIIASNGVVCEGMPVKTATVENLIDAIPTQNQAKALLAFSEKKAVFVVLSKKSMTDKTAVITECKKACSKLDNKAIYLNIDLDDKTEKSFLELLQPNYKTTKTNVIVFNAKGQYTAKYTAPIKAANLEAAAKKIVKSCCPPGSKKGC